MNVEEVVQNVPEGAGYDDEDFDEMEEPARNMDADADEVDDDEHLASIAIPQRPRKTSLYVPPEKSAIELKSCIRAIRCQSIIGPCGDQLV